MPVGKTYDVPVKSPDRFYLGGEWVTPSSADLIDVIQPATEDVWVRIAAARTADVSRAVAAARQAFDAGPWPRMTHAQRAEYLRAIAAGLRSRAEDLSYIWSSEMGILHVDAVARGARIPGIYEFYAGLADSFEFVERHEPAGGGYGWLVREPVGVVGAIIPWNAAIVAMSWKIAPALLAGCTVVLKSAPEAPVAAYLLAEVAEQAGLPPGVLNIITADREVSEELVRDPGIDKISFTGSTAAGRRIAGICAERVARVNLELGGKSAALILDDYDIGTAAASLAESATELTGQVCSALTRVIVTKDRHDELVEALSAEFAKVRVGDPFDANTDMGPVAMKRQLDKICGLLEAGREEGAVVAAGGRRRRPRRRLVHRAHGPRQRGQPLDDRPQRDLRPGADRHPGGERAGPDHDRQRLYLRTQLRGVYQRRGPRLGVRAPDPLGHGRAQRASQLSCLRVRRLQAVRYRARGRPRGSAAVPGDQGRHSQPRAHDDALDVSPSN